MPRDVRLATIWHKPGRHSTGAVPDYYLHETDDWLVLPYELVGLSAAEIREHKPYVADLLDPSRAG